MDLKRLYFLMFASLGLVCSASGHRGAATRRKHHHHAARAGPGGHHMTTKQKELPRIVKTLDKLQGQLESTEDWLSDFMHRTLAATEEISALVAAKGSAVSAAFVSAVKTTLMGLYDLVNTAATSYDDAVYQTEDVVSQKGSDLLHRLQDLRYFLEKLARRFRDAAYRFIDVLNWMDAALDYYDEYFTRDFFEALYEARDVVKLMLTIFYSFVDYIRTSFDEAVYETQEDVYQELSDLAHQLKTFARTVEVVVYKFGTAAQTSMEYAETHYDKAVYEMLDDAKMMFMPLLSSAEYVRTSFDEAVYEMQDESLLLLKRIWRSIRWIFEQFQAEPVRRGIYQVYVFINQCLDWLGERIAELTRLNLVFDLEGIVWILRHLIDSDYEDMVSDLGLSLQWLYGMYLRFVLLPVKEIQRLIMDAYAKLRHRISKVYSVMHSVSQIAKAVAIKKIDTDITNGEKAGVRLAEWLNEDVDPNVEAAKIVRKLGEFVTWLRGIMDRVLGVMLQPFHDALMASIKFILGNTIGRSYSDTSAGGDRRSIRDDLTQAGVVHGYRGHTILTPPVSPAIWSAGKTRRMLKG